MCVIGGGGPARADVKGDKTCACVIPGYGNNKKLVCSRVAYYILKQQREKAII